MVALIGEVVIAQGCSTVFCTKQIYILFINNYCTQWNSSVDCTVLQNKLVDITTCVIITSVMQINCISLLGVWGGKDFSWIRICACILIDNCGVYIKVIWTISQLQ